jgi:hypothetical protein
VNLLHRELGVAHGALDGDDRLLELVLHQRLELGASQGGGEVHALEQVVHLDVPWCKKGRDKFVIRMIDKGCMCAGMYAGASVYVDGWMDAGMHAWMLLLRRWWCLTEDERQAASMGTIHSRLH